MPYPWMGLLSPPTQPTPPQGLLRPQWDGQSDPMTGKPWTPPVAPAPAPAVDWQSSAVQPPAMNQVSDFGANPDFQAAAAMARPQAQPSFWQRNKQAIGQGLLAFGQDLSGGF